MHVNQVKLEKHDTYEEDEKITTTIEPIDDSEVINKAYQDEKLFKLERHLSFSEQDYNELKLLSNKKSVEEVLLHRAVETTIQIVYIAEMSDHYNNGNAYEVLKDFLFVGKRRSDLEEVIDYVIQWFCLWIWFLKKKPHQK